VSSRHGLARSACLNRDQTGMSDYTVLEDKGQPELHTDCFARSGRTMLPYGNGWRGEFATAIYLTAPIALSWQPSTPRCSRACRFRLETARLGKSCSRSRQCNGGLGDAYIDLANAIGLARHERWLPLNPTEILTHCVPALEPFHSYTAKTATKRDQRQGCGEEQNRCRDIRGGLSIPIQATFKYPADKGEARF
jgi:hypothetical protein